MGFCGFASYLASLKPRAATTSSLAPSFFSGQEEDDHSHEFQDTYNCDCFCPYLWRVGVRMAMRWCSCLLSCSSLWSIVMDSGVRVACRCLTWDARHLSRWIHAKTRHTACFDNSLVSVSSRDTGGVTVWTILGGGRL